VVYNLVVAVYTDISDDDLRTFLEAYEIGALVSVIGIAEGVENSNFLLLTDRGRYILTVYEKRVRAEDLPFFIGLMSHLSNNGVACPTPVSARDGSVLQTVQGKPAAIVTFLDGVWPRRVWPEHCRSLGLALADLHLAGQDYAVHRPNDLSVASFRPLFETSARRADEVMDGLADALDSEIATLEKEWPEGLPAGVIHADLFPDNVFFQDEQVSGVIDFYFACNDFFAYDLAICLNAWCFEPEGDFNITKARQLLSAYRRRRAFSDAELSALPLLCRGAAMRFLLTRLHDWLETPTDALVDPKNPMEYWHKLRFHGAIKNPGAYGLD
jgi:homoserine kinase type II